MSAANPKSQGRQFAKPPELSEEKKFLRTAKNAASKHGIDIQTAIAVLTVGAALKLDPLGYGPREAHFAFGPKKHPRLHHARVVLQTRGTDLKLTDVNVRDCQLADVDIVILVHLHRLSNDVSYEIKGWAYVDALDRDPTSFLSTRPHGALHPLSLLDAIRAS
jgi:hypothetical protein